MKKSNSNYLELIKELALTNFKLKYQGSVLGYLWSLVKPLMLFMVLYLVFTKVFRIGGVIPHYPVYLLLGVVMWGFFAEITAMSMYSIVGSGDLIRKVYFPRIVLVISSGMTSFMTFIVNLLVVLGFLLYFQILPRIETTLLIFILFELLVLAIGISFFLSSLFVKYRDVSHIWDVFMQAFFYLTPILYPITLVPGIFGEILLLNPLAQIIQDARFLLISDQVSTASNTLDWPLVLVPYFIPFILFFAGYRYFNKAASKFAEEV